MKELIIFFAVLLSACGQLQDKSAIKSENRLSSVLSFDMPCRYINGKVDGLLLLGKVTQVDGTLQEQGVFIINGRIEAIDRIEIMKARYPDADVLECQNAFFSPGFINPHEHTSFSYQYPDPNMKAEYVHREEWQEEKMGKYKIKYDKALNDRFIMAWVELRHLLAGETTIAGSGRLNGLTKNVTGENKRILTENCSGHTGDASADYQADLQTFPFKKNMHDIFYSYCNNDKKDMIQLTEPDVSCCVEKSTAYVAHVGEGTDCTAKGEVDAFFSFVKEQNKYPKKRKFSMVHAIPLEATAVQKIKDMNISLVWSPRSNVVLYGTSLDPIPFLDAGASVALGTDWSPSGSFNILEEMRCAQEYTNARSTRMVSAIELWRMTTIEAARSLGIESETGSIEVGKAGDIVIIADPNNQGVSGIGQKQLSDIWGVMVDGKLLAIESTKVIGSKVDEFCTQTVGEKRICANLKEITNMDLPQLIEANKNNVDLFSTDRQSECKIH